MSFERDNIHKMAGYSYGEQPSSDAVIKLNTNENPYPPGPAVESALANFKTESLRRYPPALANEFRTAAAKLHDVAVENIIATRGGDELLRLLFTTFANPGDIVAVTEPTYSLYPVLAQIQDAKVLSVPLKANWALPEDFAATANSAGAKMTFVVNPHAPSGTLITTETIRRLATELNSILLVDEAYVDFVDPGRDYGCIDLVRSHENVIFLRSLSKGYGLAGLRFGYGIGHTTLVEPMLTKTRDSYNLDAISQQLATAAILDQRYAKQTWARVRASRRDLHDALEQRGFGVLPSESNFLLASAPDTGLSAEALYLGLKEQNVLVRFFNVVGMNDKLRITIGTDVENAALLLALDRLSDRQI
ncbi:MAG: histidinol-phosphate aminotransferase [Candidatus Azotimanducaceae bacterium]|jgi:histidinol-phosphate aminotransferase